MITCRRVGCGQEIQDGKIAATLETVFETVNEGTDKEKTKVTRWWVCMPCHREWRSLLTQATKKLLDSFFGRPA